MTSDTGGELSVGLQSTADAGRIARDSSRIGRLTRLVGGLFDRAVNGITWLMLGAACHANDPVPTANGYVEMSAVEKVEAPDTGPRSVGNFTITFYYMVGEDEVRAKPAAVAANENNRPEAGSAVEVAAAEPASTDVRLELASVTSDLVTLYDGSGSSCEPIAEVSKEFAFQIRLQGTGKLHDGRVVNIWGPCSCERSPCFKVTRAQWGTAGTGRALQPFRTIAVDPKVVKLGSLLYMPLLEGRTMPGRAPWGGYVHDGCVVADDTGGSILGNRIDLFVGRRAYFLGMSGSGGRHAWARNVPVFDGTKICERKGQRVGRRAGAI